MSTASVYRLAAEDAPQLLSPTLPTSTTLRQEDEEEAARVPSFSTQLPRRLAAASATTTVHTSRAPVRADAVSTPQPSVFELLTALPLLLSLDSSEYEARLDPATLSQYASAARGTRTRPLAGQLQQSRSAASRKLRAPLDGYGDAATTAVRAVLYSRGPSGTTVNATRRRLRRVALDAFFDRSLSSRISSRMVPLHATEHGGSAAAATDGVREATERLLAHTRAVMADVSPTQAHLVDLFAGQILVTGQVGERGGNVASSPAIDAAPSAASIVSRSSGGGGGGGPSQPADGARGILKPSSGVPASQNARAATAHADADASPLPSPTSSIAVRLLYVILRTSIAANTPLRHEVRANGIVTANEETQAFAAPADRVHHDGGVYLPPSPTTTASSTGSLLHKKARLDVDDSSCGPSTLFSHTDAESIRCHPGITTASTAAAARQHDSTSGYSRSNIGTAVLPYEPQCWLGPSTIALVEQSAALRRQQRWGCDGDPVIEAAIAGKGEADAFYNRAFAWGNEEGGTGVSYGSNATTTTAAAALTVFGRRNHWLPQSTFAAGVSRDDAVTSLVCEGALPFDAEATYKAGAAAPYRAARSITTTRTPQTIAPLGVDSGPTRGGKLHWGLDNNEDGETDPTVAALFSEAAEPPQAGVPCSADRALGSSKDIGGAASPASGSSSPTRAEKTRKSARASPPSPPPPALPLCRTPFVLCSTLYDPVLYAHVHAALHRCTAGLIDPYELTCYTTEGGPNMVAIRVRPELYDTARKHSRLHAHSGLTSMLEWGCACGTLLLRLHRLCEVADGAAQRAILGSYGRCVVDTLRVLLCLLQRQMDELGHRVGGPHRLTFAELLTAQQRLQGAAEQVHLLATFFSVPGVSAAADREDTSRTRGATAAGTPRRRSGKSVPPPAWDPAAALQESCCSARVLSRLHALFTARHTDALGRHGSTAAAYSQLQHDALEERLSERQAEGGETGGEGLSSSQMHAATAPLLSEAISSPLQHSLRWEQQRKDLLSHAMDACGLLLRAALRPLHAMLHRWLTMGEVVDPYDEFFIVPSHGVTHGGGGGGSGFTIDFSPQRLPSFISPAAARDLLQAGISLRVLRAAATHVVRSAQKDVRRLHGLAEVTEGAAEDFAEELRDTQTLQTAIERFVERLVRGAPTVHGEQRLGGVDVLHDGSQAKGERAAGAVAIGDAPLPLPPCVDVLSAYGAIEWWRQHYQACTEVLLEAVEDAAAAPSSDADNDARREDEGECYDDDNNNEEEEERERNGVGAVPAVAEVESAAQTTASISATMPADTEAVNEESGAVMVAATTAVAAADTSAAVLPGPPRHLVYPPSLDPTASATMGAAGAAPSPRPPPSVESDQESQPYITVFMNSEDDEDERGNGLRQHGQQQGIHQADRDDSGSERGASSSSSPSAASSAASSVLGLRRLAGSEFSTGTTVSSTASSRGTIALYGAIAEELRQVALLEQRTEERVDASRHALRAEFDAQMWRRRREARLAEWRAQRLALRLLRLRAMENMAEELRDVYGIRGVGRDEEAAPPRVAPSADEQRRLHNEEKETEGGGGGGGDGDDGAVTEQTELSGVVVRLSHYPPARAAPPVLLYADDTVDDKGGPGHSRRMRHSRRTSFAASATMMEWEPSERRSERRGSSAISSGGSVDAVSRRASYSHSAQQLQQHPSLLLPPSPHRPARLRSASGPTLLPSVYGREGVPLHARRPSQDAASTTLAARTRSPVAWPRSVTRSRSSPAGTHAFADPRIAATNEGGGGVVDSLSSAAPGAARSLPASPSQWARAGGAVRQLRDVAPSALASLGSGTRRMSAVTFTEDAGGVAPASMPPPHEDHQQQQQQRLTQQDVSGSLVRRTQQKTTSPPLHEDEEELSLTQGSPRHGLGSSVANSLEATQSREGGGGRRDELGYEHPDAHYVVADINDDEFLWMRTGPRSYARREAEQAALARLATRQEELNRCTVDAPAYLEELRQRTAALLGARETGREAGESCYAVAAAAAAAELPHTHRVDGGAEEDNVESPAPKAKHKNVQTPPLVLSALWSADDPLGGVGHTSLPSTYRHGTEQLWSWTPAEAHRWYFDRRVPPLHRVLVGSAVDDALLLDTPLTTDEAAALQQCSGYYRALGQYTASFLTHKALQLTLLPPYGTLYRLTTQFLDVCLLQKAPAAVRIIDSWVGAVDAALEMMAEQEAEELLRAAIAGEESVPAPLASLTDRQRGMDVPATLAVLNGAFQREWAAAVEGGETTVKLAWTVGAGRRSRGSATAANHRASATAAAEEDGQEEGEGEGEDGLLGVDRRDRYGAASAVPSPHLAWHHQGADDMDLLAEEEEGEDAEGGRRRASVPLAAASDDTAHASIQFFLSHLELAAVSPWCSGAWLLPERTTQCTGAIFRTLLFWKSVDRLVLHTWRAGMESGLSTVFFFCTTVRQVLLSTLHEQVWAQLTELTAAYRESLRFEAGVLYTYRALESFTRDHDTFLDDCEFYALCSAPFKRRVQPLLQAMTRQVEVAERALRFAQVSTRVARRQYMATYRSMVGDGDDEDGRGEGSDEGHSSRSSSRSSSGGCDKGRRPGVERSRRRATGAPLTPRVRKAAGKTCTPTASSAAAASGPVVRLPHVFTPSRWSRGVGQRSATAADTHDSNVSESAGRSAQATPAQQLTAPSLAQRADATLSLLKHGAETSQPASKKQSGAAAGVRRTASQRAGKTPTRSGGATPRTGKGVTVLKTQSTSVSTTRSISPAIGTGGHKHGDRSASAVSVATTSTAATASSVAAAVLHAEGGERGESVAAESSLARSSSRGGHSDDESSASHSDSSSGSGSDGHSGDDGEQTQSTRSLGDPTTAEAAETNPLREKAKKKKKKTAKGKRRRPTQAPAKDAPPRRSIMESATMNTTPIYAAVLAAQEQQRQQQQLQLRQQLAHWTGTAQKRSRSSTAGGSGGIRGRPSPTPLHATVLLHQAAADYNATASAASGTTMAAAVSPASSLAHWSTPKQAGRRQRRQQQQQRQRTGPRLSSVERRERRAKLRAIAERKIEEETLHQRRRVRDVIAGRLRRFATLTESLRDALSAVIAEEDAAAQRRREAADGAQAEHEAQRKLRGRFAYLSSMIRRLDALIEVMASQV